MARVHILLRSLSLFLLLLLLPHLIIVNAQSSCGGPCRDLNDCQGQLICIRGKCNDDPDVGTHICSGGGGGSPQPPSGGSCGPSGTLTCSGRTYKTYTCSPPVLPSTPARLTNNNFEKGGEGGGPSECDNSYHSNSERIVALSTGWYAGGSRCGKMIRITAKNGRSTTAKVVDECDSRRGCDAEHGFLGPCDNNIVDASNAVWNDLRLDINIGIVDVTWSMA